MLLTYNLPKVQFFKAVLPVALLVSAVCFFIAFIAARKVFRQLELPNA